MSAAACPECKSELEATPLTDPDGIEIDFGYWCEACGRWYTPPKWGSDKLEPVEEAE